jgi:hypothetical protein
MGIGAVDEASRAPAGRDGWPMARADRPPSRVAAAPRRRNVPYLLVGVLLVLVCAGGGVVAAQALGGRMSVLALARPVAAGHALSAGDVRAVEMASGSGVDLIPAVSVSTVVGRPVAFTLPAGSLLTRAVLGPAQVPAAGEAVAAVGLKPGQFPPDVQAGARVTVVVSAGTDAGAAGGGGLAAGTSWTGVVVGVTGGGGEQTTVVSVRMSEADARAVAAAPAGRLTVVVLGGGG